MTAEALLQRIRAIELFTKRPSNQLFHGGNISHHKGRGMSFCEVRNYTVGDEVRFLDWNVTARFQEPYVKVFEEERDQQLLFILDVSQSMYLDYSSDSKWSKAIDVLAHLAFSAAHTNDTFGILCISDQEELFIPPAKGIAHAYRILKAVIHLQPKAKKTDLSVGFHVALRRLKQRTLCCVVSDFSDIEHHRSVCFAANKKHDVVAFHLSDEAELELPQLGFLPLQHVESLEKVTWVDLNNPAFVSGFKHIHEVRMEQIHQFFRGVGIDYCALVAGEEMAVQLKSFFKTRR